MLRRITAGKHLMHFVGEYCVKTTYFSSVGLEVVNCFSAGDENNDSDPAVSKWDLLIKNFIAQ